MALLKLKTPYAVRTAAECFMVPGRIKETLCFHSVIICVLLFHMENNTAPHHSGAVGRASHISMIN